MMRIKGENSLIFFYYTSDVAECDMYDTKTMTKRKNDYILFSTFLVK